MAEYFDQRQGREYDQDQRDSTQYPTDGGHLPPHRTVQDDGANSAPYYTTTVAPPEQIQKPEPPVFQMEAGDIDLAGRIGDGGHTAEGGEGVTPLGRFSTPIVQEELRFSDAPSSTQSVASVLGHSRYGCGGCCLIPRGAGASWFLVVVIVFPVIVFLSSVVPPTEWFSFVIAGGLCAMALLMQLLSIVTDPGIIPRQRDQPPVVPGLLTLADGTQVAEKVCPTCNIIRPPRSSHCSNCDYCVAEFDHHCGVVGSCVAQRTFRFFTFFFYFLTPLGLYVFVRSVIYLNYISWSRWDSSWSHWDRWRLVAALGCTLYSACGGCCALGQGGMYTELSCANTTAKLRVQGARQTHGQSPEGMYTVVHADKHYSCSSCCVRLFGRLPKSRV